MFYFCSLTLQRNALANDHARVRKFSPRLATRGGGECARGFCNLVSAATAMAILNKKPRAFIGSSKEDEKRASDLASMLSERQFDPMPWFDFFKESRPPLQELEKLSSEIDCAVLIGGAHDQVIIREQNWRQMRDNVLFEYALFSNQLGRSKCTLMLPDREDFHIPSDLLGLTCF